MSLLIDTHAHLNFKEYREDGEEVIGRSLNNNIWLINVGAEYITSSRAVEIAQKYGKGVYAAVGLHPIHLGNFLIRNKIDNERIEFQTKKEEFDYKKYKELASQEKVVAIGEIGLDYFHLKDYDEEPEEMKALQKQVFLKQLDLAEKLNKPIIIHCREAHKDLLKLLKTKFRGVVHSFSGNYKQAREYRTFGFKIAFNGIITFARDYDKVILDTPLEDILLETDCPYLAPIPYRGQRNEPLYVVEVAKKLAEIKGVSLEEVAEQTTANAKKVFNLI